MINVDELVAIDVHTHAMLSAARLPDPTVLPRTAR